MKEQGAVSGEVVELRERLSNKRASYILLSELPATRVELIFEGGMQGEPVVWHACVRTIDDYATEHAVEDDPMQFIAIDIVDGVHSLEVGLNLKRIDHLTLERTIIMIRLYKRLRIGCHQYGARSKTQ